VFLSKIGGNEIPPRTMQYLFNWGGLPVGLVFLAFRRFRMEKSFAGISYGMIVGVLSGLGQLALFAAFRGPANTSVVTVLRERLTKVQMAGLGFAAAAFIAFSF